MHPSETWCTQRPLKAGGHCRTMNFAKKQPCQYRPSRPHIGVATTTLPSSAAVAGRHYSSAFTMGHLSRET